ncbi:Galactan endo-beta-1,3-galactanase [Fusarium oxysporum f. sp. albedinis]|nr:Galactan endo-beta-1,3-galactanase [Fusarium oxysporum f. sp. albedinis]
MMMIKGLTLTGFGTLSEGQVTYFDTLRDGGELRQKKIHSVAIKLPSASRSYKYVKLSSARLDKRLT